MEINHLEFVPVFRKDRKVLVLHLLGLWPSCSHLVTPGQAGGHEGPATPHSESQEFIRCLVIPSFFPFSLIKQHSS